MAASDSTFNILIVDDSSITRLIVQHVLRDAGMVGPGVNIIEAQNGHEGYLAATEGHIDIIFSDMHMPLMTGLEMLEHIRARNGTAPPVVFVTSEKSVEVLERATCLGAVGIIAKPFTNVSFREILQQVLVKKPPA